MIFEDVRLLVLEYEKLSAAVPRYYWQAKEAWQDVKECYKQDPKNPPKVTPHIQWFLEFRQKARDCRNNAQKIKQMIESNMTLDGKSIFNDEHNHCDGEHDCEDDQCLQHH
ncbi:MAG: hypothetical protein LC122_11950 [Chitinophagales bacterium]|nr:hypothetical protein [Chitinophagales bacterium]